MLASLTRRAAAAALVAAVLVSAAAEAGSAAGAAETLEASARGFGHVRATARFLDGNRSWTTFAAEDEAHARVCASKRLADLLAFGDLKLATDAGLPGTVVVLDGAGAWLLGTEGASFHELFAPARDALAGLAAECGAKGWQAVAPGAHPRWLDCFDTAGPGVWVGGGGVQYTLPSDFEWLRDRRLAMCTLSPTDSRLVGPGLIDMSIYRWHTAMAARYGIPYRVLCFPSSHEWLWNREPLPYVRPAPGCIAAPWLQYEANTCASAFEPVPALDPYVADFRVQLGGSLQADPNYVGMHGCTEIPEAGVGLLAAVADTPGIRELWRGYLASELGMTLDTVGMLHKGDRRYYASWADVAVPRPEDFLGWDPAVCLDLHGTWQMHEDTTLQGVAGQWFDPAKAPGDWVEGDAGDPMILVYTPQRRRGESVQPDFWMRRTVALDAAACASLKYLHIGRSLYHGNPTPLFDVWVNGEKLKTLSEQRTDFDQCFALDGTLRAGENTIVLNTHGAPVPGHCFLGPVPLRRYPGMTPPENRLWFDAVNFDAWLRVRKIEENLRATRVRDPNRPLKLMATINLLDMTGPLCETYGAYQHDTGGAGGYWAPMTGARLARTHGLPWSCEQGGPPRDAEGFQAAISRYIMYGNDAVDLVFAVTHYRDKPDVAAWFDRNLELIHCIGKMHLPLPAIGILRSTRATRLGFAEPWNWDIGRGALQAVGRNFAYLEVPDILSGDIDRFPVVFDDGTVLLTDDEIEGIQRYVRRGGIFVAQHHTGRHSPSQADAWPLARAYGLHVTPKLITAENYNHWPLARIRFTEDQNLLPGLRGKELEGSGIAIDYLGVTHTGAIGITAADRGLTPVARWEDGTMAVAEIRSGRGRFILLGTPFYTRMRDVSGIWVNAEQRSAMLDEFLTALGVPRDSWTGNPEFWAELWQSKNAVYDLYPVIRMTTKGAQTAPANVAIRRAVPPVAVTEVSAAGHPRVAFEWKDGRLVLPETPYTQMQTRVYIAPRADLSRSALDWFAAQSRIWRALPPLPDAGKPLPVAPASDLLPLADGWTLHMDGAPERAVALGSFAAMDLPETAVAAFEKTVEMPAEWKGRRVTLVFDAEHWFWGILPSARLLLNGKEAPVRQPIMPMAMPGFSMDVTDAVADTGVLAIRLEIDGTKVKDPARQSKPNGVTGLFYLQAETPPVKTEPLPGPWMAADAFNRFRQTKPGEPVKCVYLETRFTLPETWPAARVSLESPSHLGFLVLNGKVLLTPSWMKRLDVTGMVRRDGGANVLRWVPGARGVAAWNSLYNGTVPALSLAWSEPRKDAAR